MRLNWVEFGQLPQSEHITDFHCVTRWSRFENNWRGVAVRDLLVLVKPSATASHVLIHAEQGYTTNVSIADLDREDVILATHHDGLRSRLIMDTRFANRSTSLRLEIRKMAADEFLIVIRRDFGKKMDITCMEIPGKSKDSPMASGG